MFSPETCPACGQELPAPSPGTMRFGASASGTAIGEGPADDRERQGPITLESTLRIQGQITMDETWAVIDAMERAAILTVSRIPDAQIGDVNAAVR